MKFITKRDSETGKKFAEYQTKASAAYNAAKDIITELDADRWRSLSRWSSGGISAIIFKPDQPIPSFFKQVKKGEYMPKVSTKEGAELQKKIDALPTVSAHELNMCVGFDCQLFKTIGFDFTHPEFFLFEANEDWDLTIRSDCEEITVTRYRELCAQTEG